MSDYLFFGSRTKRFLILDSTKIELVGTSAPGDFFDGIGVFDGSLCRSPAVPRADAWQGRGNYMIARHKADGSADISTDPLGQYPLYIYNQRNVFCVSNNIYLLVEALKRNEIYLKRSIDVFGYFVTQGSGALDCTGYDEVKLLEVGSRISVTKDLRLTLEKVDAPSLLYSDRPYRELLDEAASEILGNVRALSGGDFRFRICDLTGGMDSRTVLAAILNLGERDRFMFHTTGGRDSPDVNVAEFLRQEFGLASARGKVATLMPASPFEELCRTVARVGGLFSMNYVVGRYDEENSNDLSFGGGMGELMRHFWPSRPAGGELNTPLQSIVSTMQKRSGVLRKTVAHRQQRDIAQFGIDAVSSGIRPEHTGHFLYLKARTRYHFGVWWAASARRKFHPLYSPSAIKAAFALPDEERINNRVGFDLMNLLCPRLTDIPFAENSWSPLLHSHPPAPVTEGSLLKNRAESSVKVKNANANRRATVKEIVEDFQARDRNFETLSSVFDVEETRKVIVQAKGPRVSARTEATACRILGAYAWLKELDLPFRI